jgi:hypothetical protein
MKVSNKAGKSKVSKVSNKGENMKDSKVKEKDWKFWFDEYENNLLMECIEHKIQCPETVIARILNRPAITFFHIIAAGLPNCPKELSEKFLKENKGIELAKEEL